MYIRPLVLLVKGWGTPATAAIADALRQVDFAEGGVFPGGGLYPVEENVYHRRNACCVNGQTRDHVGNTSAKYRIR